jgi:DNA-binding NtrC family response regulator
VDDRDDDRSTASYAVLDSVPKHTWYLVVSIGAASSRVVQVSDGAEVVFGRQVGCEVSIDHDGVSRRHACVRRAGDTIMVEDLGSRNGTTVNGVAIAGQRRIGVGDTIAVGPATAILASSSTARRTRTVATIGELEDRLDVEIDRATRYRRPLGVAMVRIDGSAERVVARVDALLASLRRMDLVAEYGDDELVIVLPESNAAAVAAVAERVRGFDGVSSAAGTATFPDDGAHAGDLLAIARERMLGSTSTRRARTVPPPEIGDYVVVDPLMKHVFQLAARAAPTPITVLVVGETGAGKEVIAEAVHRLGPRAKGPLVRLNCASLPETLVESELFGHEKGAFTGALAAKAGYFEAATGGTLFLDEVGELPLATQPKLLRVLEQRKIVRVGGTKEIAVDVRVVCATNRDLEADVLRGRFREDLYFRLSAFVIPVPPLRDRKSEIGPIAARFARNLSVDIGEPLVVIAPEAIETLKTYDWPGNVRELRNVIERAVVLSGGKRIEPIHLPDRVRACAPATSAAAAPKFDVRQRVAEVEREAVVAALDASGGNQTHAARRLGISRFALIRLMEKHELKPKPR